MTIKKVSPGLIGGRTPKFAGVGNPPVAMISYICNEERKELEKV